MATKTKPYKKGWNAQRAAKQAENCRRVQPWTRAAGPVTASGKDAVKNNALKHGAYDADTRALKKLLTWQCRFVRAVLERYGST